MTKELQQWRQDRPPPNGIRSALGRARSRGLEASLTDKEWALSVAFFEDRCAYCRKFWCLVDHVTSLDRGGGTSQDNCLPSCGSCNRYKGQRTLEELIFRVRCRDTKAGREARLYAAITIDNLTRALGYLREKGRPLSEPIGPRPRWCTHQSVCDLGHPHRCRLPFGHSGKHVVRR